jgi:hypothetical protein
MKRKEDKNKHQFIEFARYIVGRKGEKITGARALQINDGICNTIYLTTALFCLGA